ncbi:MAG: threonine synthase [Candidatus Eisenbacteria bacterium]
MSLSTLDHLECGLCGTRYDAGDLIGLCPRDQRPLLARYDLGRARETLTPTALAVRPSDLWRYREVLPHAQPVSLGEGMTPLLPAERLGADLGLPHLFIKDESSNPTGSFKARGLALAVTMAKERGARRVALPTAGNAGLALAAYAARAGLPADVFCPADTPAPFIQATRLLGATVHLIDGVITDCARALKAREATEGWFDLSTLKEPYRLEGKKTMGYELFEQLGGRLPDWIVYPTGGGTGLVGMWKAWDEMEAMGWIGAKRPHLVSVQAEGCAPIVTAFLGGSEFAEPFPNPATRASGLRVPAAVGDFLILRALRETKGVALTVSDEAMARGSARLGRLAGVLAAPEGGATLAALEALRADGRVGASETIVLFNTGTALSYLDALAEVAS